MTRRGPFMSLGVALAIGIAACGGGAAQPAATNGGGGGVATSQPVAGIGGGGGGGSRGFDCAVLVTPAELDQISGFKGATVTTTSRGDQNADVPGYGECAFEEPDASIWFGSIGIHSGDSISGFDIQFDFNKEHGAAAISGLGTEAILVESDAGTTIMARSSDGVGITVGLAWDTTETTRDAAKQALQQIAQTVLSRV